jgi:hypothetical protein
MLQEWFRGTRSLEVRAGMRLEFSLLELRTILSSGVPYAWREPLAGCYFKEPICNFPPVAPSGIWKLSAKLLLELVGKSRKIRPELRLCKPTRHLSSFDCSTSGTYPVVAGSTVV